jgi:hypothetical protein
VLREIVEGGGDASIVDLDGRFDTLRHEAERIQRLRRSDERRPGTHHP